MKGGGVRRWRGRYLFTKYERAVLFCSISYLYVYLLDLITYKLAASATASQLAIHPLLTQGGRREAPLVVLIMSQFPLLHQG